ncbi:MAG: UDP-N-acetylmuramate dehydrogenase, partial [Lachnospiraceae bacterium]|nr:UDP-N-acetylmuramate dehydrogenase [Lachnospiraceae bacterium]
AAGIPGSVGGAVAMNAGAFDGEIRDVIRSGRILFPGEGILELSKEELDLSYRHSILKEKRGILLDALFDLHFWEKEAILDRMKSIQDARKEKQPLEYPSAGSTFKRPEGYYAGKLISDAGCKGLREGAACVSEKHAGFIVNLGGASASEIYRLMRKVQERVLQHSGVMLEPEVILLGEFDENA